MPGMVFFDMATDPVKSAQRTLALLELFSSRQRPMTVGAIARDLAIPQASASMLLKSLTTLGYLAYDPSERTYLPTLRVVLLGGWIGYSFSETQSLSRRLGELRDKFDGLSAFIGIQNGAWAQYILVQDGPGRMMIASGQLRLLTRSALGQIFLSMKPAADVRLWARRCNAEAVEERHRVGELPFLETIARVRRQGYAETLGDWRPDNGAIAVAVASPIGDMPLGVGIGGSLELLHDRREAIVASLLDVKAEFNRGIPKA